jgi:putative methionine-R-sulfoxide reductase with GAF domain
MSTGLLEAIDAALAASADADDALRETVRILAAQPGVAWAGIAFVETTGLVLGPTAGTPEEARRALVTVCYKDETVGELQVDGDVERGVLEAVAARISAHVLLGWDTGGTGWEP